MYKVAGFLLVAAGFLFAYMVVDAKPAQNRPVIIKKAEMIEIAIQSFAEHGLELEHIRSKKDKEGEDDFLVEFGDVSFICDGYNEDKTIGFVFREKKLRMNRGRGFVLPPPNLTDDEIVQLELEKIRGTRYFLVLDQRDFRHDVAGYNPKPFSSTHSPVSLEMLQTRLRNHCDYFVKYLLEKEAFVPDEDVLKKAKGGEGGEDNEEGQDDE